MTEVPVPVHDRVKPDEILSATEMHTSLSVDAPILETLIRQEQAAHFVFRHGLHLFDPICTQR